MLQVNLRLGEFAQAGPLSTPLMLLGNVDELHVRVDVDENDAWRVGRDAAATAYVRGNPSIKHASKLVRIEPYVIPKKSLTGDSTERVDTRVLQVIYAFDPQGTACLRRPADGRLHRRPRDRPSPGIGRPGRKQRRSKSPMKIHLKQSSAITSAAGFCSRLHRRSRL